MESELRIFIEEDGYFTIRELIKDDGGTKLISLNALTPLGKSLDELKSDLAGFIRALDKTPIREGDYEYFTVEYDEPPPQQELH